MNFTEDELREFNTEAAELLDQAESSLLSLDKGGDFKTCYDNVFRVFHSLKGGAGMLGLSKLQHHMHSLENIFSSIRDKASISSTEATFFLDGVDVGRKILAGESPEFTYTIPDDESTQAPQTPAHPTPAQPVKSQSQKVENKVTKSIGTAFLADDEPDILESLIDILTSAGIECTGFSNPLDLVSALKTSIPDVIITDINMPQMSGLELMRAVRQFNHDIPIIIVSGYINVDSLLSAIQSGVFAAIEKPYSETAVINATVAAIRQHGTFKLIRRSINLLMYQFSDLEDFLISQGKQDIAKTAKTELHQLISIWKSYSSGNSPTKK